MCIWACRGANAADAWVLTLTLTLGRYEREETFMALNLGVTSCQSLEISLDQFVRGEVLEGSNAYYCEKCKEKVLHLCLGVWVCGWVSVCVWHR